MVDVKAESQVGNQNVIDVDSLQQEVIELLDDINLLIDDTQADLNSLAEPKYNQFQQQIAAAGQNVADLQLRMAIVAPMKAGKSTIINAITGQELLPSCAVAMTTIPTEITFNSEIDRPILHLSSDTRDLFGKLERELRQNVERLGIAPLQQRLSRYPHLLDLFAQVAASNDFTLTEKVTGVDAIATVLNRLNHLIRLYSVIEPTQDPLAQLKDVPCIETPSLNTGNQEQAQSLGNLTIIDTPGPNEAGDGLKLTAVVEEQLRRSSIVLVVLDFTQFNSEAAETIKQQIQPIVESIGTENLYVLVNKVDQRRQGDMTPEQVKEFVIADLDLNANSDRERVFEVAAIRAFAATRFLLEVQQNPGIQLLEIKSLTSLAPEVLGIDWDEELDDITVKILVKKARKLWRKSGFAPFIDSAIAALIDNAAPQCLNNALSLSRNHLLAIRDDLNLRNNAISQDTAKIQREVESLEQDLSCLESCRDRLSSIADIKIKLQQNLQQLLEKLKAEAAIDVENFFVSQEYAQANAIEKADISARNLLLSNLGDFELFPKWVSDNLKAGIEYKTAGIVSFKTELEAEYFTQEAVAKAKQRLEQLILQVSQNIEAEVKQAKQDLEKFLVEETQGIIERAKNRLQTTFEVELDLPSPIISNEQEIQIERQLVKTKSRLVDDGYEERLVKKRAWYYWFGTIPFYSQEKRKKPYRKEDYYTVSVHEIVEQINLSSEIFVDGIQQKITAYLEQELHQQVDSFFIKLDQYLSSYLQSLQQAQADGQLSLSQRESLSNSLARLVPKTTNYINRANNYLAKTQQILKG
ncbi:dynamin family protein [Pleurocapsales cyanobacterium LEGE 10410]|nr:dynamin family protein [Pleurocapsales cyanobacterium LEGE 10410]